MATAAYIILDAAGCLVRILWMPIKAAAWALRMVTYLAILAAVAGVLYGLWSSGIRPW